MTKMCLLLKALSHDLSSIEVRQSYVVCYCLFFQSHFSHPRKVFQILKPHKDKRYLRSSTIWLIVISFSKTQSCIEYSKEVLFDTSQKQVILPLQHPLQHPFAFHSFILSCFEATFSKEQFCLLSQKMMDKPYSLLFISSFASEANLICPSCCCQC